MTANARLFVRNVSPELRERIRLAAHSRGMTVAEYLERLVRLHDIVRFRSATDARLDAELEELGLQTVSR